MTSSTAQLSIEVDILSSDPYRIAREALVYIARQRYLTFSVDGRQITIDSDAILLEEVQHEIALDRQALN